MKEDNPEFPVVDRDEYSDEVARLPVDYIKEYAKQAFKSEKDIVVVFQEEASWDMFRYTATSPSGMWVMEDPEQTTDEIIQRLENESIYSVLSEYKIENIALSRSLDELGNTFMADSDVLYENE
ncbi:hypothetical protein [Halorubrum kocurii]|uniref:hypothetical protein n=1 Tax=Halorubrum kocurii TaxID=478441 RepID=UPI001268DFC6|nr:hypothetical protein [Halorubrum kocurii]